MFLEPKLYDLRIIIIFFKNHNVTIFFREYLTYLHSVMLRLKIIIVKGLVGDFTVHRHASIGLKLWYGNNWTLIIC